MGHLFFALPFECRVSKLLSLSLLMFINSHFYINSIYVCELNEVKKNDQDS